MLLESASLVLPSQHRPDGSRPGLRGTRTMRMLRCLRSIFKVCKIQKPAATGSVLKVGVSLPTGHKHMCRCHNPRKDVQSKNAVTGTRHLCSAALRALASEEGSRRSISSDSP